MFLRLSSYYGMVLVLSPLILTPRIATSQDSIDTSLYNINRFNTERHVMLQKNTNEAFVYFKNGANYYVKKKDTVNYLNCIVHLSDIEKRKGLFNRSFDLLWDALPIAHQISNKKPLLEINQMLGILYGIYGKDSIALSHTKQGLQIAIEYAKTDKDYSGRVVSCYLDVAERYISMEEYTTAISYLDSCYLVNISKKRLYFVDAFYGQAYLKMGDNKKAQARLNGVIPFLKKLGHGFQTSVYYYMGELNSSKKRTDSAIFYYEKSLKAIDSLQYNIKLKPLVLEDLALAYNKVNKGEKAFLKMKEAKILSDSLFNIQSKQNKVLFEIKNKYKEDLDLKELELDNQNKLLKVSNKAQFRLKLIIGILILLSIIAFVAFRLKSKIKLMAYEKALNEEKNETILEVKNKELTANALQLIEKEQAVKELLEAVMVESPDTYKSLRQKHKQSNKKIWEDFHMRFTQTNDKFYEQLLKHHPELTPTDLKHCALMKLNFDSKEMSHLLGISINSVHMARSRIRKKLKLNRKDILSNYLTKI